MAVSALAITSEHARQFREDGFFVLKRTVPPADLDTLRGECQRFIDERDQEMDRLGVDNLDLDWRGSRYFVHAYGKSPAVERPVLGPHGANRPGGARGYGLPVQRAIRREGCGARDAVQLAPGLGLHRLPAPAVPHLLDRTRRRDRS